MVMFTRAHALRAIEALSDLQTVIVQVAEATWTGRCRATRTSSAPSRSICPITCWRTSGCSGATHGRFEVVLGSTAELPLGSGALAGVNFPTDRRLVASELGFTGVVPNSIDARLQPRLRPGLPLRRAQLSQCRLHHPRYGKVRIGKGTLLGPNVQIYCAEHHREVGRAAGGPGDRQACRDRRQCLDRRQRDHSWRRQHRRGRHRRRRRGGDARRGRPNIPRSSAIRRGRSSAAEHLRAVI